MNALQFLQPFLTVALPIMLTLFLAVWSQNKRFDDMNRRLDEIVARLARIEVKLDNVEPLGKVRA